HPGVSSLVAGNRSRQTILSKDTPPLQPPAVPPGSYTSFDFSSVPITEIAGTNPVAIMPQSFEATTRPKPSLSDEIKRLHGLMAEGVLTQSEFEAAKSKLLS
ncbi:MAG: SHOCT domain-containing protein, partial [Dechloromonas sp.]|nr:SHOCT domain-containing protein [Dechloromonas sp.]